MAGFNNFYCIYMLKNLETNKVYIGQTTNLKRRMGIHFSNLRNGKHNSKAMQQDHTPSTRYEFSILNMTSSSYEATNLERFYQHLFKSHLLEYGYNCGDKLSVENYERQMKQSGLIFSGTIDELDVSNSKYLLFGR